MDIVERDRLRGPVPLRLASLVTSRQCDSDMLSKPAGRSICCNIPTPSNGLQPRVRFGCYAFCADGSVRNRVLKMDITVQ
jgi:hypothetical protein